MENNINALRILTSSLQNIKVRQGKFTIEEIEADVINQACKFILENYENEINAVHDINQINLVISQNMKFQPIAEEFINAANNLFPDKYGERLQAIAMMAIIQNISWAGMWDFLVGYFQKKHGISIDDRNSSPSIFYSTRHERYHFGDLVSASEVKRNINCNFFNEMHEIVVSIEPTLSAKKANLIKSFDNKLIYQGEDPDYRFEIYLDQYEEIEKFVLDLPNRDLKLIYY